jgi:acetyl-CoA/propionyl-CoA carboxylase carboxyl transferase subunit
MGAVAAVRVLHRRILAELPEDQRAGMELELAAEHDRISGGIERAVEIGAVDEVISPQQTRRALAAALASAPHRRGTHTNIPL